MSTGARQVTKKEKNISEVGRALYLDEKQTQVQWITAMGKCSASLAREESKIWVFIGSYGF